jgi:hypothetical protein
MSPLRLPASKSLPIAPGFRSLRPSRGTCPRRISRSSQSRRRCRRQRTGVSRDGREAEEGHGRRPETRLGEGYDHLQFTEALAVTNPFEETREPADRASRRRSRVDEHRLDRTMSKLILDEVDPASRSSRDRGSALRGLRPRTPRVRGPDPTHPLERVGVLTLAEVALVLLLAKRPKGIL